jgi:SAM-dependent methyltransferase
MMGHLAIDFSRFTFVDIGSGKGRALLLASEFPFEQIVGVEILDSLHRIAEENVRLFASKTPSSVAIRCLCEDAQNWVFPTRPLVVYLFNPLLETGLLDLMAKLERSLKQDPRPAYVLYHNPVFDDSLGQTAAGFKKLLATEQYRIYAYLPASARLALRSPGKMEDWDASKVSDGKPEMPSTKATDPGSG